MVAKKGCIAVESYYTVLTRAEEVFERSMSEAPERWGSKVRGRPGPNR